MEEPLREASAGGCGIGREGGGERGKGLLSIVQHDDERSKHGEEVAEVEEGEVEQCGQGRV